MHILVTGGAGFIGSHVVDQFLKQGDSVTVLDNLSTGSRANVDPRATFVRDDVRDYHVDDSYDVIVHLAAQIDVQSSILAPDNDADINIGGTINMLRNAKLCGAKLVLASSAAVYHPGATPPVYEDELLKPTSPYGMSKLAAEGYVNLYNELHNSRHTILRFANVYGPRQGSKGEGGVIYHFVSNIVNGTPPVVYGDGNQTRDFVYVEDVAKAVDAAANNMRYGTYNVSTGRQSSLWDVLSALDYATDSDVVTMKPERPGDIRHSALRPQLIKAQLGWSYVWDLHNGLAQTQTWMGENKS